MQVSGEDCPQQQMQKSLQQKQALHEKDWQGRYWSETSDKDTSELGLTTSAENPKYL